MHDQTQKIIAVLRNYMTNTSCRIHGASTLSELGIDRLDLPMIFLDLEEAFSVRVGYHDDIESLATVDGLVSCLASSLSEKALQADARRLAPRKRSTWVSTRAA